MVTYLLRTATRLVALSLLLSGCGGGGGGGDGRGGGDAIVPQVDDDTDPPSANVDTSDVVFDPGRVLQIGITMDPDDYEVVRREGRSWPQVWAGCWAGYEYSHFVATVTIDGNVFENVDIRKKGFLGSLSAGRPAIKLNLDTHEPGRRYESLQRFTLNNDRQDPSHTHQCITYQMFRDAGLPAPRCHFARVRLNGQDLGIYSSVESVKRHFLRRNFGNDDGNLYEAQVADFGDNTKENFQLKLEHLVPDRSDLDGVVDALKANDATLPDLLGQVLDIDQFIDFWAMETMMGHWDGAAGNANNFLIYHDPDSNLFHHIPWGTDGAMRLSHPFRPDGIPLYRYSLIPTRLYDIAQYREQYHARLLQFLDTI
jgi:spore coat protein CotH